MWILRRKKQWNRPVETVLAAKRDRRRRNIPHLSRGFGHSHHAPTRPGVVHHIRVQRIWNRIAALSWTNRKPVALRDLSVVSSAGGARRAAVLLRSVHPVWKPVICRDPVKLSRRLVVPRAPGFPSVEADRRALIHTEHDSVRIRRIDPYRVVIVAAGSALDGREVVPAVVRTVQVLRGHIHHIGISWIDENLAHVPETDDAPVFRGFFPARSSIVGTVQTAIFLFCFHNQVHSLAASTGRHRDPRPSPIRRGQPMSGDRHPREALVG